MRPRSHPTPALLYALLVAWVAAPASATDVRYPEGSVVDLTRPPYLAVPDDGRDDAPAIQRAITDHVGTGRVLYLPAGVYDVHQPLVARNPGGRWRARLTIHGESRERTVLRLPDAAPPFADPSHPRALLTTASIEEPGDSPDGGGNKAYGNYVLNLTIDTGAGNPGAIGVDWAVSNFGAIEGVTIRSADGAGVAGVSIARRIPGPGLIKDVAVDGFDVGIDVADVQYGITLERVSVRGQRVAGVRNGRNVVHVRGLSSVNAVPAVRVTDRVGVLTLVDASLTGGAADAAAIESAGGVLLRDIDTAGYAAAARCRGARIAGPRIEGFALPGPLGAADADAADALLPIRDTPEHWEPDLAEWVAVGPRRPGEPDDTAAIQRAFDAGRRVVYFPNDRTYFLSDTVVVRGSVRHVLGLGSEINLGAAQGPFSNVQDPRPLIRIDPTDHPTIVVEHLFFNAQYPGEVIFENNTPAAVVIAHCGGWVGAAGHRRAYRNTPRANGPLFIEDVFLPGWRFDAQDVWARQFNPENPDGDGVEPQVANVGGRLWVLGFKTEGPAPYLATTHAGVTELLGAYNYVSATAAPTVPRSAVPYVIDDDARAALTFVTDNFRDSDYDTYIRADADGETARLSGSELPPRNGHDGDRSFVVPLYRTPE